MIAWALRRLVDPGPMPQRCSIGVRARPKPNIDSAGELPQAPYGNHLGTQSDTLEGQETAASDGLCPLAVSIEEVCDVPTCGPKCSYPRRNRPDRSCGVSQGYHVYADA